MNSFIKKQQEIKLLFSECKTAEDKYQKIIELGKAEPKMDIKYLTPENLVKGCQSLMYLHCDMRDNVLYFSIDSDAIISRGLAALLVRAYNQETPESLLKCPPTFLDELGISHALTPSRASGLYHIHLRMKQEALKFLVMTQKIS